jgi:DNA segregation ATPase FtsK/SpoIIIE-like protein
MRVIHVGRLQDTYREEVGCKIYKLTVLTWNWGIQVKLWLEEEWEEEWEEEEWEEEEWEEEW